MPVQTYSETIRKHQVEVAWINCVHAQFSGKHSVSDGRQRNLVLALSAQSDPLPVSKLPSLTLELAASYARKTARTLARDVNELERMELIRRERGGVIANRQPILAFLPWRNKDAIRKRVAANSLDL